MDRNSFSKVSYSLTVEFVVQANVGIISVIGRTLIEDTQRVSEIREMMNSSTLSKLLIIFSFYFQQKFSAFH